MKGIANNYYIVLLSNNLERKRTYFVQEEKVLRCNDRLARNRQSKDQFAERNEEFSVTGNNSLLTGRILLVKGNMISITGIQTWLIIIRSQTKYS